MNNTSPVHDNFKSHDQNRPMDSFALKSLSSTPSKFKRKSVDNRKVSESFMKFITHHGIQFSTSGQTSPTHFTNKKEGSFWDKNKAQTGFTYRQRV